MDTVDMHDSDGTRTADPASAAYEIWHAFHGWWEVLDETLGTLEAGRAPDFDDTRARLAAEAAIGASPWSDRLSEYVPVFERAGGFVRTWAGVTARRVDLPPRGTGGFYLRMAVRHDARGALDRLAGFLFGRLRDGGDTPGDSR